ncbi:hypothetical protein Psi02_62620 [Planotetraspora silvatica]|uniref:DUF4190 domain-containing protein n=2 Tax=Planotetraspora silvatica TaxID=234614 RepID=A0A8J3UR69_9ACTN|nr:hypothetical protein Psi02_62620 [Planotetraspora silvatica]
MNDPDDSSGRDTALSNINALAVASFVSGLCSLLPFPGIVILLFMDVDSITEAIRQLLVPVVFPLLFPGLSVLGIVSGHIAQHKLRWTYGRGSRIAFCGVLLSYLTLAGGVLFIAWFIWLLSQLS